MNRSKLRIALIASNRHPISQPFAGGLEAHVWHLARALTSKGHDVALFAAPGSDQQAHPEALQVHELQLSTSAQSDTSMPADRFMADHHAYQSLMIELAQDRRFDLLHNHCLHYLPIAMAPTLSTPMLCTLHTPPTPWLESAIATTGGRGVEFVAVSDHTAGAWRPLINDVGVVRNGVDPARWPMGPGGDELVWFGRITPEKGAHLAIEAAQKAKMPLVLAGPISDEQYFLATVKPQLGSTVRYAGHLTQRALADLVGRSAAALVTPLWDEPYGLVVAEALACGTPVVAFARGGVPEILPSPGCGALVAADDVAAMSAALPRVVALPREPVREHALRYCSADGMVTSYLDRYRQMITTASRTVPTLTDSARHTA